MGVDLTPEQFRDTRKRLGLTQKGLATALRMGSHGWQTISKWESGATPVPGPVSVAMDCLLNHAPVLIERSVDGVEVAGG